MNVDGIDHVVLTVKDVDAACAFYAKVLGMTVITFGDKRRALTFGVQKINLYQHGKEIEPKASTPAPGSSDLCFVTSVPMPRILSHLAACGVAVLDGPVQRTGARGPIVSVYFRDPDMNLIEVSNYAAESSVREFRDSDLSPVHRLICETIDASYSSVYPKRAVQFFKRVHSRTRIAARSKIGAVLVLERDGILVATGAAVADEIVGLFVNPKDQGRGFGRAIMAELERRIGAKGYKHVVLDVSLPSRKFYEALGYEMIKECSTDVGHGEHLDFWQARKALDDRPVAP